MRYMLNAGDQFSKFLYLDINDRMNKINTFYSFKKLLRMIMHSLLNVSYINIFMSAQYLK